MAEPVSSIVTLTTVSLAIIRETAIFIREAKEVDALIQKLVVILLDLRKWLKAVDTTWRNATFHEDGASRLVRDSLAKCKVRLEQVQAMVTDLATRNSRTFFQKIVLKIRSDRSRRDIEEAIQDIERHREHIKNGMLCWNTQLISDIHRRTSEALPVVMANQAGLQHVAEADTIGPLNRTLSVASTAFEIGAPTRRTSSATAHSRHSISSTTSSAPLSTYRTDSLLSDTETPNNKAWVDFHYQIRACRGDEKGAQAIKGILERSPESSSLANTKDDCGRTPLHITAQFGYIQVAHVLLSYTANINAKDRAGHSVLDHALDKNQEDFIVFLIEKNADVSAVSSKKHRRRLQEIQDTMEFRKRRSAKSTKRSSKSRIGIEASSTSLMTT